MMTLADWEHTVSPHLQFIEAGCAMAVRHARFLPVKPGFESKAEAELARTKKVLEAALANIEEAQSIYSSKEVERAA